MAMFDETSVANNQLVENGKTNCDIVGYQSAMEGKLTRRGLSFIVVWFDSFFGQVLQ
jgi:hypothetical protein